MNESSIYSCKIQNYWCLSKFVENHSQKKKFIIKSQEIDKLVWSKVNCLLKELNTAFIFMHHILK